MYCVRQDPTRETDPSLDFQTEFNERIVYTGDGRVEKSNKG
jgi:hypothetical protein